MVDGRKVVFRFTDKQLSGLQFGGVCGLSKSRDVILNVWPYDLRRNDFRLNRVAGLFRILSGRLTASDKKDGFHECYRLRGDSGNYFHGMDALDKFVRELASGREDLHETMRKVPYIETDKDGEIMSR